VVGSAFEDEDSFWRGSELVYQTLFLFCLYLDARGSTYQRRKTEGELPRHDGQRRTAREPSWRTCRRCRAHGPGRGAWSVVVVVVVVVVQRRESCRRADGNKVLASALVHVSVYGYPASWGAVRGVGTVVW
jgi:hypothetical protein